MSEPTRPPLTQLTDRSAFTFDHCGQPMTYECGYSINVDSVSPNAGSLVAGATYTCSGCGSTVNVSIREV